MAIGSQVGRQTWVCLCLQGHSHAFHALFHSQLLPKRCVAAKSVPVQCQTASASLLKRLLGQVALLLDHLHLVPKPAHRLSKAFRGHSASTSRSAGPKDPQSDPKAAALRRGRCHLRSFGRLASASPGLGSEFPMKPKAMRLSRSTLTQTGPSSEATWTLKVWPLRKRAS